MKKIIYLLIALILVVSFTGCAAKGYRRPSLANIPSTPGVYHKVKKGETLWKISKEYNVNLEDIVRANKIPDASKVNAGQSVFIPYAGKPVHNTKSAVESSGFIWPVKGKVIVHFGMKYSGVKSKGILIKAKEGDKIVAARGGKVSFCNDKLKGKGKTIIINHEDGFVTVYAHNSENLVSLGERVKQGKVIAKVGTTGRAKIPELYFEIRKGHIPKNPFYYLP